MKKTIVPGATPEAWDAEALFLKAQRYAQRMAEEAGDGWEHILWSSLALEFLARAALSNVSPALLADRDKGWSSLYHSLGFSPTEPKFSPKSITITEVVTRLSSILLEFNKELESFCILHTGRRNAELHSGENAFEGIAGSAWQPRFYRACDTLLASMGLELTDLVGPDEAEAATKIIAADADDSAKAVRGDVEAHKKVWLSKEGKERTDLATSASVWATRQLGHRVTCPSCGSTALVAGEPISTPTMKLEDDVIKETQEYLPSQFECIACGLKIHGLSRLIIVGLGDRYRKIQTYDAAEYYAPEDEYPGYEDDNNERY